VADNIASCWVARDLFGEDTLLLNGDTLVSPEIIRRLRAPSDWPIRVAVDEKPAYDADDMKVRLDGPRLGRIGKDLAEPFDGESIGALRFSGTGGARFAAALDAVMREPGALQRWYLSVIDRLADQGIVAGLSIAGLPWAEVDYPHDLAIAQARVATFDWGLAAATTPAMAQEAGS